MGTIAQLLLELLEWWSDVQLVEYDPDWSSPCVIIPPNSDGMVKWQPIVMNPTPAFDHIALHLSLCEFFGSFWGKSVEAEYAGEAIELRVAWNAEDRDQIMEFVREQVLAGTPVFIAHSYSDGYFGVDNVTGVVWLCEAGYPPIRPVAESLAQFLMAIE
jgi:SecY interacting protein Syd